MESIFLGSPDSSSPISRLNSKFTRGSLFAGIAGDQGFDPWFPCRWQVEIEPFCRRVLRTHYPDAKRFRDVRKVGAHNLERVDSEENFPLLPKGLDSPRYRALGNAWTVQVGAWIAHRIAAFESGAAR